VNWMLISWLDLVSSVAGDATARGAAADAA
jgi:hypothetical protein